MSPEHGRRTGKIIINGAQGITGTPNDSTFLIGVILLLITLFLVLHLIHSRDGRAIMAIRDNRIAAESIGINITKYKMMAFTISAALAGVAGVPLCPQSGNADSPAEEFWLQYVHHDSGIRGAGRHRKYPRLQSSQRCF